MNDYEEEATVYFIENGRNIREALVIETGAFYLLRYNGYSGEPAGIRLRKSRIYKTKEAAEAAIKQLQDRSRYGKHYI